jgi:hypothetical protein
MPAREPRVPGAGRGFTREGVADRHGGFPSLPTRSPGPFEGELTTVGVQVQQGRAGRWMPSGAF